MLDGEEDFKIRDTDTTFSSDQYLYDLLCPFVVSANEQAGWKYDLDWFEAVQIARYKKNQHYSWHTDGDSDHFGAFENNFKEVNGKVRKISLVACLSDGYIGGDFELAIQEQKCDNEILYPEMRMGDVIVFPSYVWHRVTEVKEGERIAMVGWIHGPTFS